AEVWHEPSEVEPKTGTLSRDRARERLMNVDVLGLAGGAAKQARRGGDLRDRATECEVDSEAGVAWLHDRPLGHQLEDVELEGVVVEIEHPKLIRARPRTIEIVGVARREEPIQRDFPEPGRRRHPRRSGGSPRAVGGSDAPGIR